MKEFFIYETEGTYGVVFATSKLEAEHKVREAYAKHYDGYTDETPVEIVENNNNWFADAPDVIEVY